MSLDLEAHDQRHTYIIQKLSLPFIYIRDLYVFVFLVCLTTVCFRSDLEGERMVVVVRSVEHEYMPWSWYDGA